MTVTSLYSIAEHLERVRAHPAPLDVLLAARGQLFADRDERRGEPWVQLGPPDIARIASDPARAGRLLATLEHGSIAAVLPPSLTPLVWLLAVNAKLELQTPPRSARSLGREAGERFWEACSKRLEGTPLTAADRQRIARGRKAFDEGLEFRLEFKTDPAQPVPEVGASLAFNASALALGTLQGGASWGGFPAVPAFVTRTVDIEREAFTVAIDPHALA